LSAGLSRAAAAEIVEIVSTPADLRHCSRCNGSSPIITRRRGVKIEPCTIIIMATQDGVGSNPASLKKKIFSRFTFFSTFLFYRVHFKVTLKVFIFTKGNYIIIKKDFEFPTNMKGSVYFKNNVPKF
jgi:hypothetical protein